eukprot:TRINITY_DN13961_c0_g1_i25.p1 TRINITY_DN13961_c0_g1~~TRINITY_DN13961_c0_g1_i25.p1  ORF type:complete len:160 (+),score=25.29 TRINITY_DN13961_c0_g1_i25:204-683(+)
MTVNDTRVNIASVYRPAPSKKNKFTHAMFLNQFLEFLEHCDSLQGKTLLMGDFNVHFDDVDDCNTKRFCELLDMFSFSQSVVGPTHKHGHTLDLVIYRTSDDILSTTSVNNDLHSDHSAIFSSLNVPKPVPEKITVSFRSIGKNDKQVFHDDLSKSIFC